MTLEQKLMVVLAILVLLLVLDCVLIAQLKRDNLELHQRIEAGHEVYRKYQELSDLVWDHMVAKDQQGRAFEDADSGYIEGVWEKYHKLNDAAYAEYREFKFSGNKF